MEKASREMQLRMLEREWVRVHNVGSMWIFCGAGILCGTIFKQNHSIRLGLIFGAAVLIHLNRIQLVMLLRLNRRSPPQFWGLTTISCVIYTWTLAYFLFYLYSRDDSREMGLCMLGGTFLILSGAVVLFSLDTPFPCDI